MILRFCFLIGLLIFACSAYSQDTLFLISGRIIPVKSVELKEHSIVYSKMTEKPKFKRMDPERVFSIKYADGHERVIFRQDTLDPLDFTEQQMRMFMKGEQDATIYYKNNINKGAAFVIGAGSAILGIWGLAGPPLYSTIVGSFSPNMMKQKVSDPALINVTEYCEGYERKVRDRKIRNALVGGLGGFIIGVVSYTLIYQK